MDQIYRGKPILSTSLQSAMYLLHQFNQVRISHVFREVNRYIDYFAKGDYTLIGNFVVLDSPISDELYIILDSDASSQYSLKLSAITSPFMAS